MPGCCGAWHDVRRLACNVVGVCAETSWQKHNNNHDHMHRRARRSGHADTQFTASALLGRFVRIRLGGRREFRRSEPAKAAETRATKRAFGGCGLNDLLRLA